MAPETVGLRSSEYMNGSQIANGIPLTGTHGSYASVMRTLADVPEGPPLSISATLFVTYHHCPQQAIARVRGIYGPPSRASFKGLLAHRVFARHLSEGPIVADDLGQVCREETGAHLNPQFSELGLKPSEFRSVVTEVSELYDRFRALPTDGFERAEVPFEMDLDSDISLRGRVDAVFSDPDGDRIVDWKTGKELGDDAADQLAFYAWAWSLAHGAGPARTEAISVTTGERLVREFSATDLDVFEDRVAAMVGDIRKAMDRGTDLARTGGPHCTWCPLLEDCAEGATAMSMVG